MVTSQKIRIPNKTAVITCSLTQTVVLYLISDSFCRVSSRHLFWRFPFRAGRDIRCPVAVGTVRCNKFTAQNWINQTSIMRTTEIWNIKTEGGTRNSHLTSVWCWGLRNLGVCPPSPPIRRNDGEFTYLYFLLSSAQDSSERQFSCCFRETNLQSEIWR